MSLPSGYTELEYIQSSGTQFINTGISPSQASIIEVTMSGVPGVTPSLVMCGVNNSSYTLSGHIVLELLSSTQVCVSENAQCVLTVEDTTAKNTYIIDFVNKTFSHGDDTGNFSLSTRTTEKLGLFGAFATDRYGKSTSRAYRFKAYDSSNALIADLVPCKDSNDVVGMYDLVGETFIVNTGTGDLIPGPEAVSGFQMNNVSYINIPSRTLPSGYTELEYLCDTNGSYINLGIKVAKTTEFEIKARFSRNTGSDSSAYLVSAMSSSGKNGITVWNNQNSWYSVQRGTPTNLGRFSDIISNWDYPEFHEATWKLKGDTFTVSTVENGVHELWKATSPSWEDSDTFDDLYMFARNRGGSLDRYSSADNRIYSAKFWKDGEIVRDLVPCTYNGTVGFYDFASNTFLPPTAGTFTAGPAKSSAPVLPAGYVPSRYISSVNGAYINLGRVLNNESCPRLTFQIAEWQSWSGAQGVYGARDGVTLGSGAVDNGFKMDYRDAYFIFRSTAASTQVKTLINDKNIHTSEIRFNDYRSELYIDESRITELGYSTGTYTVGADCYLMGYNDNGTLRGTSYSESYRVYKFEIVNGHTGVIEHQYIPCHAPNGEIGVYDTIGGNFYGKSGNGLLMAEDYQVNSVKEISIGGNVVWQKIDDRDE